MPYSHADLALLTPRVMDTYLKKIKAYQPISLWPSWETTGTVGECLIRGGQDGTYDRSVASMGTGVGIGDGYTAPLYNGTGDLLAIRSSVLDGRFNGNEGAFHTWIKVSGVGVWTDATSRTALRVYVSANNQLQLQKSVTDGTLSVIRSGNGTQQSRSQSGLSDIGWIPVGMSWSDGQDLVRAFLYGEQLGADHTSVPTFSGSIDTDGTCIAAPWNPWATGWDGYIYGTVFFAKPLPSAAFRSFADV